MAGTIQHEIPRLFQRGFLIRKTGNAERVYVFRRGGNIYASNIDRSGAERHFYSKPAVDGSSTLDDSITEYEPHLASLVDQLRALPAGSLADPAVAAEVIAHLTTRNAHLRGAFTHVLKKMASKVSEVFGEHERLFQLLGLNEREPSERFRKVVGSCVREDPRLKQLDLPAPVLERVAFFFAKENFSETSDGFLHSIQTLTKQMEQDAKELAADSHKKALAQSVIPDVRVANLSAFQWRVVTTNQDIILPDCVALGLHRDGESHPLMMADHDETIAVLLPLSSRSILTGTLEDSPSIEIDTFNLMAATCSHSYFVCASKTPAIEALVSLIGQCSVMIVDKALNEGVEEFLPSPSHGAPSVAQSASKTDQMAELAELTPPNPTSRIGIQFVGDFDQDTVARIGEELREIVAEASWTIPLDRLDGVTFADDYQGALRNLDRGFTEVAPVDTAQNEAFVGIAQSPAVLRDGVAKGHVVAVGWIARALIGDDEPLKISATYIIAHQLALVGFTQVFDETLPGVLLTPFRDGFEADLHNCVYPGWNGYFAARASAKFGPDHFSILEEILTIALRQAQSEIPSARLDYRQHGDLSRLFHLVLPRVRFVLEHTATLLGHTDGLGQQALENDTLVALLNEMHLRAWVEDFRLHLNDLWDRRGAWDSFDEFLALNRHTERLLWQFGIFPWRTSDGEYRVEIPLASDAEALLKIMEGPESSS